MAHPLQSFIVCFDGPENIVRACRCCTWFVARRRHRIAGKLYGNQQRSETLRHVNTCPHVAAAITTHRSAA